MLAEEVAYIRRTQNYRTLASSGDPALQSKHCTVPANRIAREADQFENAKPRGEYSTGRGQRAS